MGREEKRGWKGNVSLQCWGEAANWNLHRIIESLDGLRGCFVSILMSCPDFQSGNYAWPIQIPSLVLFCC